MTIMNSKMKVRSIERAFLGKGVSQKNKNERVPKKIFL